MDSQAFGTLFLDSAIARFSALKAQAERAVAQVDDADLHFVPDSESNSVAVLIQHVSGNLISRWTDFLTTDGEKPNRDRDGEFIEHDGKGREELLELWERGWHCLHRALAGLGPSDLNREVLIRGEKLSVLDAIHRQLVHYGQHVGQIVYLAKHRKGSEWKTLSIPRAASIDYRSSTKH